MTQHFTNRIDITDQMFGFLTNENVFGSESPTASQSKTFAYAVERNAEVVQKSADEIRDVFDSSLRYSFDEKKFTTVTSSLFAALVIDNIKKQTHYDEESAISAFVSEIGDEHLAYVDVDDSFDSPVSERDRLKREAATWAAQQYFNVKEPSRSETDLFYERAQKFVDFIAEADREHFGRNY